MDGCPNEILGLVFEWACTDDGLTGRSLSLVSRHIRDISRRYAFQSVALYGSHQLSAFASLLDKAELKDRDVRHLYLTDRRRVWMECLPSQDREQWLKEPVDVAGDFHADNPSCKYEYPFSAILRILKAVSPTLQTLTLLLFDQYDEPMLSDTLSFPNLRELTIHSSNMAHNAQSELPQCLSLRRLHIVQHALLPLSISQSVSRLAPLLTHLRISRLLPDTIVPSMDLALNISCTMLNAYDPTYTKLPPTLERVLVQMVQKTSGDPVFNYIESVLKNIFKAIAMQDVEGRFVLLQPVVWDPAEAQSGEIPDVQFYSDMNAAWQEGVDGSASTVWDVDRSSILASYEYCAGAE